MHRTSRAAALVATLATAACTLCAVAVAPAVAAEPVRFGGTGSAMGTVQRLAEAYRKTDPAFSLAMVPNLGSTGGVKALQAGAIQLAGVSRPLKADELSSGLQAIEYGRTAFALITTLPGVESVSRSELAEMLAGQRARWPDGTPVRIVLRPPSDGDSALLASMSPQVKQALAEAHRREGMVVGTTDQDAVNAVERLNGGLSTASIALLVSEQRRARPLALDGVAPTAANVVNGSYPFSKAMYLVVRHDAPGAVRKFLDFVHSEAGRRILADTGHVLPGGAAAAGASEAAASARR